jgi:hypothetical protein
MTENGLDKPNSTKDHRTYHGCGPGGRRFESGRSPLTEAPHMRGFSFLRRGAATVTGSRYADVLDFDDGLITRFLVIQDLSAVVDGYRSE